VSASLSLVVDISPNPVVLTRVQLQRLEVLGDFLRHGEISCLPRMSAFIVWCVGARDGRPHSMMPLAFSCTRSGTMGTALTLMFMTTEYDEKEENEKEGIERDGELITSCDGNIAT
jgi:hypothetical protein